MTNKELESRLANGVHASTPDMLDSLTEELNLNETPEPSLRDRLIKSEHEKSDFNGTRTGRRIGNRPGRRHNNSFSAWMSIAAMLVLVIGLFSFWNKGNRTVIAVVDLDVNPGIEISINEKERVIETTPVNKDGEIILADMDLKGSDITVACNAIVGSMLTKGYLTDQSNSILVSVYARNPEKGRQIEESLADNINQFLDNTTIAAAILGQYVDEDDELRTFAQKNGISLGKAWLIRKLLSLETTKMTEESLLALSTQELILLGQERSISSETTYGKADTSKYIGQEKAIEAALKHTGLKKSQITGLEAKMDCEDGMIIYEVEFHSGGHEYEIDIDAVSGMIIDTEIEPPLADSTAATPDKGDGSSNYGNGGTDVYDEDDDDDDDREWDDDDDDDDREWDDDDDDREWDDDDDDDDDRDDDD